MSRPAKHIEQETVRQELLSSGRRLFAAKGYDGMTLKDLAQATGHNAALVNYYFKSKEGLFRECVMPLFGSETSESGFVLRGPKGRQDLITRFELFVERFIEVHLREQDICIILQRDLHTEVVKQLFKQHVHSLHAQLLAFFKAAQKKRLVREDVEICLLAKMIISSLFHLISLERFREELDEPTFLNEKKRAATVNQIACLFLNGFIAPER